MVSFEQLFEGREGESHLETSLSGRWSDTSKSQSGSPVDSRLCQEAGVLAQKPMSGQIQLMRPKRYRKGHIHLEYL